MSVLFTASGIQSLLHYSLVTVTEKEPQINVKLKSMHCKTSTLLMSYKNSEHQVAETIHTCACSICTLGFE